MDTLSTDFFRFTLQHSWYKHIDLSGAIFWAFQQVGQQPRNGIHPNVTDVSGIHWWFSRRRPNDRIAYPFQVGPFLRGLEKSYDYTWGISIIIEDAGFDTFQNWIREHYPQWAHIHKSEWISKQISDPILLELYRTEQIKYWNGLLSSINKFNV